MLRRASEVSTSILHLGQTVVQQVIRPTGLLDPQISVRPTKGQIDDLLAEIRSRVTKGQRVLVTLQAR